MILWRAGFRYLLRHPLQICFAVIGVALGVTVVVAIDMANISAERAFRLSAEALMGRTTHMIVAGAENVSEDIYSQLRITGQWRQIAPVVEGYATIQNRPDLVLNLIGIDPLAERPFRNLSPSINNQIDLSRLLTESGTGLMTSETANKLGLTLDDSLMLSIGGKLQQLTLIGFLDARGQPTNQALENLVVVDIASAQEMFGQQGELSRIDLILPQNNLGQQSLERLRDQLPDNVDIIPANVRSHNMVQMTHAFQLNLRALSLLALMVGMFLIYNTMTFSIVQRRPLLGALRTLGVTRCELFSFVLLEAILIGTVGTTLGLGIGILLAKGLLTIITRTINDLYFVLNVQALALTYPSLCKGMLLGIGATTVAAFVPALEAARTTPQGVLIRSSLERRHRSLLPWLVWAGLCLILASLFGLMVPSKSIIGSFMLMFILILGYALISPGAVVWLLNQLQPIIKFYFGILGKMAARNLLASLSRTGVATSALVIAVAATIGVGLMIDSFRSTVDRWLESYLQADIYLTTASTNFGPGRAYLQPELLNTITKIPGIARITKARHLSLQTDDGISDLFVADIPQESFDSYWFKDGNQADIYRIFQNKDSVIVSEPYAYHHGLERGDHIELLTDQGKHSFLVAGIFTDYGSDRGRITMSRTLYQKYWKNDETDSLGLYLEAGYNPTEIINQLRISTAGQQQVVIYSNLGLREASLATFDRTFAVTTVLRMLAILVAFVGILNALMAMQIERSRELAVLRAGGLSPQQLWLLVIGETGLIGLIAGLLALPLGILQALVLILVINRRSFGWSMQISIDPVILFQAMAIAILAALLAGLYPAWRMSRTPPALALRED